MGGASGIMIQRQSSSLEHKALAETQTTRAVVVVEVDEGWKRGGVEDERGGGGRGGVCRRG